MSKQKSLINQDDLSLISYNATFRAVIEAKDTPAFLALKQRVDLLPNKHPLLALSLGALARARNEFQSHIASRKEGPPTQPWMDQLLRCITVLSRCEGTFAALLTVYESVEPKPLVPDMKIQVPSRKKGLKFVKKPVKKSSSKSGNLKKPKSASRGYKGK
jgi:hypothetical protein